MQVILLDKIVHLGNFGEKINVKAGYARNFLVPYGKAIPATKKNVDFFEIRRAELEAKLANIMAEAEARAKKINELGSIVILSKAGNEGKLFGSIGIRAIAEAITKAGINVAKSEVRLPSSGGLRTTGEHKVTIHLHREILAMLNVIVVATS